MVVKIFSELQVYFLERLSFKFAPTACIYLIENKIVMTLYIKYKE